MPQARNTISHHLHRDRVQGFSLVEMVVVLCILSLTSLGILISMASWLKKYQSQSLALLVQELDRWGRDHSQRHSASLVWDLDKDEVQKHSEEFSPALFPAQGFPGDIQRIVLPQGAFSSGRVRVHYRSRRSTTWAVKLKGRSHAAQWLIFHGLSGEIEIHESNERFDALLPKWISQGLNAS